VRDVAERLYLHPGDWVASGRPMWVSTVLGPCVAVCFWYEVAGVGGMNHVVLPYRFGTASGSTKLAGPGTRYLLARVMELDGSPQRVTARLFGGACTTPGLQGRAARIGADNVEAVREVLRQEGIPVLAEDVGGTRGRRVAFGIGSGRTEVTLL